mmetsp:Transcript_63417/g.186061  ORF Transcript_63417/g.186061 Transcript_63417/m.186061 type:complete len:230 (+) Transcript_63417:777-1466(+)
MQDPHVRRHEDGARFGDQHVGQELEDGRLSLVLRADERVQFALRELGACLAQQRVHRGVGEADALELDRQHVHCEDRHALVRQHHALALLVRRVLPGGLTSGRALSAALAVDIQAVLHVRGQVQVVGNLAQGAGDLLDLHQQHVELRELDTELLEHVDGGHEGAQRDQSALDLAHPEDDVSADQHGGQPRGQVRVGGHDHGRFPLAGVVVVDDVLVLVHHGRAQVEVGD